MTPEIIGRTIGGCRIESKLGQGGMGIVYKAHHIALDIPVAFKILHFLIPSIGDVERFLREARVAARLRHQNIVRVLNVGSEEDCHFIVMEFFDGQCLSSLISEQGKLSPSYAVAMCVQILDALEVAFVNGVVHRDIKPENIMVDKNGMAKLADLGLARFSGDSSVTQSSISLGSPNYRAPEQAENAGTVDHRADIYSLGCTLYHALTGRPPYSGTSQVPIILDHLRQPIPSVKDTAPEVSEYLSDIVYKMMEKDPLQRFQCPADVKKSLLECLQTAHPPSTAFTLSGRSPKKKIRLKGDPIAAAITGVVILGLIIVGMQQIKKRTLTGLVSGISLIEPEKVKSTTGNKNGQEKIESAKETIERHTKITTGTSKLKQDQGIISSIKQERGAQ